MGINVLLLMTGERKTKAFRTRDPETRAAVAAHDGDVSRERTSETPTRDEVISHLSERAMPCLAQEQALRVEVTGT